MLKRSVVLASASALASSLFGAPIAADIIAYRTEDGVFAYTDDRDKVPARYAADAVTVRDAKLQAYPRLTIEDTDATREVSARLEKRLDYLRQANAASAAERAVAATSAVRNTVTIPTGTTFAGGRGEFAGEAGALKIDTDPNGGPIVVEPIRTKDGTRPTTRRSTLVKQDDRVLAVIKGQPRHTDVSSDFYDEEQLAGR